MRIDSVKTGALTLITSCGCNLKCEYCHIAQAVNADSPRLQKETIQALQDGSFLKNVKDSLARIEQSPGDIEQLSLWGQEPTLTLHYITANMEDWLNIFPNCKGIMFVTNGMGYGDRIVDFLFAVDKYAKNPIKVEIQFSFDGEESTDNIRNADSQKIYNTITYVIQECNRHFFKNLHVGFNFHGVISLNLLKRLNTQDKIETYFKNLNDWAYHLYSLNLNKSLEIHPLVGVALENPVDASTEDGLRLADFFRKSIRIHPDNFLFESPYRQEWTINTLIGQYQQGMGEIFRDTGCNNVSTLVKRMVEDPVFYYDICRRISLLCYCGNSYGELKLMYDGTIINCQNSIYDRDEKFILDDGSLKSAVKKAQATHHYFVNLLTDDEETIRKHFELFRLSKEDSFMFIMETTITLMYWLSQAHQIDESYRNFQKIIEHSLLLAYFNCCYYNNYVKTGSMFLRATGYLRFFCNGFMDLLLAGDGAWGEKI